MKSVASRVYDGDECVADADASGNPIRSYVWGQGIDDLLAVTVYTCQPNSPQPTASSYHAVKDHLGSVHALVDESGEIAAQFTYDAWGNVQSAVGNGQSAVLNRFLFQGREYSFATGLYNFRARWYDPATGRWLSKDPIGLEGGLNLYVFCGDDPVNWLDPFGLKADINLFPNGDKARGFADKATTSDGSFLVSGHGLPGQVFNQNKEAVPISDLAQKIVNTKGYSPGRTVTLGVCFGGAGEDFSSAKTLSDELYRITGVVTKVNGCDGILHYWWTGAVTPAIDAKWHQFPEKKLSGRTSSK